MAETDKPWLLGDRTFTPPKANPVRESYIHMQLIEPSDLSKLPGETDEGEDEDESES